MDKKYKLFILAAEEGHLKIVKSVLNDPDIDINYKDDLGFTALMCAAEQGHKEVTKLLLSRSDIKINMQNNKGATALMQAAKNGHKEVVKQFLNHPDININVQTRNGATALDAAIIMGHEDIVNMLSHPENYFNNEEPENLPSEEDYVNLSIRDWMLKITKMRTNKEDFNSPQNSDGWTILMYAALYADVEIVRRILDERICNKNYTIDTRIKNKQGDTALTYVCLTGDEKKIKLLFEYDAKIKSMKKEDSNDSVKVQNSLSSKDLKSLVINELKLKIDRMNQSNEDFNTPLNISNGRTLLMCACATEYANCDVIQMILNMKDAQGNRVIDIDAEDKDGNTALTIAAQSDNFKKMMLLLKNDADLNLAKKSASYEIQKKIDDFYDHVQKVKSDFITAIIANNIQKAKSLLESNLIDINAKLSNHEETILMRVANIGCKDAIELLLNQPKIDVNIRDVSGITALMCASAKGYYDVVKMLINHGADVNNRDIQQQFSALMCAAENGHEKVVRILLEHGADVNAQGNKGQTALMLAVYYGHMRDSHMNNNYMETINLLLKFGADVNIKYCDGDTALILAVNQGCEEVVNLLLKYGNVNDENRNIALTKTLQQESNKIHNMLLNHNANMERESRFKIIS